MQKVFTLVCVVLLCFTVICSASDKKKFSDEIGNQPAAPTQTAGILLQSIVQIANSAGPIDPQPSIYKGEVTAAAETLVANPTEFTSLIDGASLSSVSRDDFGQFYISQGETTDLWQMLRWTEGVWSPMYELRFGTDSAGIAIDYFNTGKIYFVPFTAWDLNGTPDDQTDDRQLIPLTARASDDENPEWGIVDTIASPWTLNPAKESSWIYLCNPAHSFSDLWDVYWEQMNEGIVDYDRIDQILDEGLLRRITINSLDDNPLTTVNSVNGLYRPAEGTIIRWTYSIPQKSVTFRVNMRDQLLDGSFEPQNGDIVVLRGNFNNWSGEDQVLNSAVFNDGIYHITYDLGSFAEDTVYYKFVIHKSNNSDIWEDPPPDSRKFIQKGHPQTLPVFYFSTDNRITFRVNMSVQISLGNFDPMNDQVLMMGKFNDWRGMNHELTDQDGDKVYTIEFDVGLHADEFMAYSFQIRKSTSDIIYEEKGDPNFPPWYNRRILLTGSPQTLPVVYFNNETLFNSVTIQDIQQVSDPATNDISTLYGDTVRVQGIVMTNPTDLYLGQRYGVFIVDPSNQQSPWNGLMIIQDDTILQATDFSGLRPGMLCEFTGIITEYSESTEIILLTDPLVPVSIISTSNPLPNPIQLSCDDLADRASAEQWECMWVQVRNASVVNNDLSSNLSSITDSTTAITYMGDYFNWFRTNLTDGTYSWPSAGSLLNVTGFVRDEAAPIGQLYSVNPRTETDLEVIPQELSVQVIYPNGDERWNEDTRHMIEWQASSFATNIDVLYSTDNGQNYYVIYDSTQNDGICRWYIPRTPSTSCKVKIVAYDADGNFIADESDGTFIIEDVQTYVHETGTLSHTIRNDGMSGNWLIANGMVPDEPSMEFPPGSGHHHLYISQLLVGTVTAIDTITAEMFSDNFLKQSPINVIDEETHRSTVTLYSDKLGLNITVEENTYIILGEEFVIISYKVTNNSSETYSNFYLASFNDFDVNVTTGNLRNNRFGYDNANRLAYMWDATRGWSTYVGVRALNKDPHAFRCWSSYVDARNYPGFIFNKMATPGYEDTTGIINDEYRLLVSFGPYTLQPGGSVVEAFALVAGNDPDNLIQASQNAQDYWNDTNVPSFGAINYAATPAPINQPITVTADVTDDKGLLEVHLKYRQGGNTAFNSVPMVNNGSDFEAIIPATVVTEHGVEFYITAKDYSNNYNASGHTMVQINVPANTLSATTINGGTAERAYTMISTPLQFDDARFTSVLDELGAYDKKQWRLYHDSGNQMQEYPAFSNMEIGKAYWIITRNTSTINFPTGRTSTRDDYSISLPQGWTQIGLPCNYDIAWGDIIGGTVNSADLDGPFYYNDGNYNNPSVLEPFRGYYVYNESGGSITLNVPLNGNGATVLKEKVEEGWRAPIIARIGAARDELNIIGSHPDASDDKDPYDHLEPPPIGNYISVYFPHPDWKKGYCKYSEDIRAESASGYVWDMEIQTNISDKQVELSFEKLMTIDLSQNFNYVLIDPDTKTAQSLKKSSLVSFQSPGEDKKKSLRLIVGTAEFISKHNMGIMTVPGSHELRQNYPNPFNPVTTITFGLPQAERVSLIIYNMLGEQVCVILDNIQTEEGYHSVQWDGKNQRGHLVASGVYFYQLRSKMFVKTRKMIFIR